jgi:hypothetical protein
MARRARKTAEAKKPKRAKVKARAKAAGRKAAVRPKRKAARGTKSKSRRVQPKSLGGKATSAFQTLVDTINETDRLRNKLEPRGSDETK